MPAMSENESNRPRLKDKCPHSGQVEFSATGVACCDCGKELRWVQTAQLQAIRALIEPIPPPKNPANVVVEVYANGLHRLVRYASNDGRRYLADMVEGSEQEILRYAHLRGLKIEEIDQVPGRGERIL